MNIGALIKAGLAVGALWAVAGTAMAVTCKYMDGIEPADGSMPLQISAITVGRDVPVGTEVYRQRYNLAAGQLPKFECSYAPFQAWAEYIVDGFYGKANWSSGTYANNVYRTGVDGLGIAFNSGGAPLPRKGTPRASVCHSNSPCITPIANDTASFEMILIKIGDVRPGVLLGHNLPTVGLYANFGDARKLVFYMATSGNIQIVSRTCSTPDVVVPMGEHQTKLFTGINSATGWKEFSIGLNNCPAFHGTYSVNAPSWTSQSGAYPSGTGTSGSRTNNSLQFRIEPARKAIDASNGVLSLDPGSAGSPPAASGVGVQIATPNNVSVPLGIDRNSGLSLRTSEGSYSIPLRARYLQTGSKVTPGPANASATFTITYQ